MKILKAKTSEQERALLNLARIMVRIHRNAHERARQQQEAA